MSYTHLLSDVYDIISPDVPFAPSSYLSAIVALSLDVLNRFYCTAEIICCCISADKNRGVEKWAISHAEQVLSALYI